MDDNAERRRALLAGRVARAMDTEWRTDTLVRDSHGGIPLLVALPTDTMGEVFARLRNKHPDGANVVTTSAGELVALSMERVELVDGGCTPTVQDDCPVHPDTQVAMLIAYLRERTAGVRCYEVAPDYEMALVPDEDRLFA